MNYINVILEYDRKLLDDKKIGRKTITDELDNKLIKDLTLTEKDIRPMFVQVQVLERGQYFVSTHSNREGYTTHVCVSTGAREGAILCKYSLQQRRIYDPCLLKYRC